MKTTLTGLLLGTCATIALAGTAHAQTETPAPDAVADTAPTPTVEDMATQQEFLQAQVEALQAQLEGLKKQVTAAQPSWKGAPQWSDPDTGFTFKPKGFVQFDAGYVTTPGPGRQGTAGGLNYNNLGFNARSRRLVFGAEGSMPGGFGYKVEFDFAQAQVSYEDIVITWGKKGSPWQFTVGNFYPLSSLETMTSSRLTSFLERASLTDAFGYNRRIGAAVAYADPADTFIFSAGLWGTEINDNNYSGSVSITVPIVDGATSGTGTGTVTSSSSPNWNRTGWQASARAVFSPTLGETRLHLGANFQYRKTNQDAQNVRYRTRPLTQVTDQRFIDTNTIAADGDTIVGLELAAIHGPVHFAGEAQKVWVRGYKPGTVFDTNNAAGGTFYADDPSFMSGYAEVGFYLTGETRGYKGGKWDRTKVLKPLDKGGIGAVQINGRVDYVDLQDRVGSTGITAPNYVNGGKQLGFQASLIWNPMDYVRLMAQYAHINYEGGPRIAGIDPTSTDKTGEKFKVDTFGLRAQLEF
jgi:phosphate-selective porin OprO/OprP